MYKKEFLLTSSFGKRRLVKVDTDYALIILSVFGLGWIKLFMDGRTTQGLINLLLMYTIVGHVIHGVVLALMETNHLKTLIQEGYRPVNPEDKEEIEQILGIKIPDYNDEY